MSTRRILCAACGAEIQSNTPLEHGGCGLPVPGICEDCREPAQGATVAGHEMKVLSLNLYPAAICECLRWALTGTHKAGDTRESKLAALEEAHKEHLREIQNQ